MSGNTWSRLLVLAVAAALVSCGDDGGGDGGDAGTAAEVASGSDGVAAGDAGQDGGAPADVGGSGDAGGEDDGGGEDGGGPPPPTPANEGSPLGTNLSGMADWSPEWAFVDAFKMSRAWISGDADNWDNGQALDVDESGWLRSLAPGQLARTLLFWDLVDGYPGGRYVVLYEGQGTIEYWSAAARDDAASSDGRDVIDVDPSQGGIGINVTSIDSDDPLRNIRVIMPGGVCEGDRLAYCDAETACAGGASCLSFEDVHESQVFHPLFLDRIKTYRVLRFMDWMATNNSLQSSWAGRPRVSDARYTLHGVPAETMADLANLLHADMWVTVPHLADDDYLTQLATLVRDRLDGTLKVYVEYSNEVWNGIFDQAGYAREQGLALGLADNDFQAQLLFYSQRAVEVFEAFEAVFAGQAERLVRVMASQAANAWVSEQVLDHGDAAENTDALAIAPYFGGYLGSPDSQGLVAGLTLDGLFGELEDTAVPTALGWVAEQVAVGQARGVPVIAYEAGQHLAGHGGVENDDAVNALFDAANRDARMGIAYASYLQGWRDAGGQVMAHFVNCGGYSKWGRWGALEDLRQPRSEAPKFDALQTFIETNTPWW